MLALVMLGVQFRRFLVVGDLVSLSDMSSPVYHRYGVFRALARVGLQKGSLLFAIVEFPPNKQKKES